MSSERTPEFVCPECHGHGMIQHRYFDGLDEFGDEMFDVRDTPCALCRATGRITRAAMAVYKARGGLPPIKARRF